MDVVDPLCAVLRRHLDLHLVQCARLQWHGLPTIAPLHHGTLIREMFMTSEVVVDVWVNRKHQSAQLQSWVQLHKITSITITLKYRLQLQLQLHHHNVILNYNYTMLISITITVPFLRKCYFFMMEYWVNRFWVVFSFWPEHCVVTLPPLSLPKLFGSIISRHTCAGHLY